MNDQYHIQQKPELEAPEDSQKKYCNFPDSFKQKEFERIDVLYS